MVILMNSSVHNTGLSTLTYLITKLYGNFMNQPSLFMNISRPDFYKSAIQLDKDWEAQPVSMVLNKLHGRNDFRPFCFKLEDTVYYYHANVMSLANHLVIKDLEVLLSKAQKDFGLIVVDIDIESNGFSKLIPSADKIILSVPPDIHNIEYTRDSVEKIRIAYESARGLAVRPDIIYVLNKADGSIGLSQVNKLLGVSSKFTASVVYSKELAKRRNLRQLDFFFAEVLIKPSNAELRKLNINLRQLLAKAGLMGRNT